MQVVTVCYKPAALVAFEMPSMIQHAFQLPSAGPIEAIVTFSEPFQVKNFLEDFEKWERWNKDTLHSMLRDQGVL